jgi:hypothetical protein
MGGGGCHLPYGAQYTDPYSDQHRDGDSDGHEHPNIDEYSFAHGHRDEYGD